MFTPPGGENWQSLSLTSMYQQIKKTEQFSKQLFKSVADDVQPRAGADVHSVWLRYQNLINITGSKLHLNAKVEMFKLISLHHRHVWSFIANLQITHANNMQTLRTRADGRGSSIMWIFFKVVQVIIL